MTLITRPVRVVVWARLGCDAADQTVAELRDAGCEVHLKAWNTRPPRFHMSPTCAYAVEVGDGQQRHQRITWSGHNPGMIRAAANINQQAMEAMA